VRSQRVREGGTVTCESPWWGGVHGGVCRCVVGGRWLKRTARGARTWQFAMPDCACQRDVAISDGRAGAGRPANVSPRSLFTLSLGARVRVFKGLFTV
jgi:hypothetical protein